MLAVTTGPTALYQNKLSQHDQLHHPNQLSQIQIRNEYDSESFLNRSAPPDKTAIVYFLFLFLTALFWFDQSSIYLAFDSILAEMVQTPVPLCNIILTRANFLEYHLCIQLMYGREFNPVFRWSHTGTCFSQLLKRTIPFSFHRCNGAAISLSSG